MYRIIIADDEILECKVLEKIINENCQDAQVLPSVGDGISLIASVNQLQPDIVIADINMPGLNGLDSIEMIRHRHPDILILVVTAYSRFEYAQKAVSLGASDYLLKPVKDYQLVAALEKLFQAIDRSNRNRQEQIDMLKIRDEYKASIENAFMSDILLDNMEETQLHRFLEYLPHPFCGAFLVSVRIADGSSVITEPVYARFLQELQKVCTSTGKIQKNTLFLCLLPSEHGTENDQNQWVRDTLSMIIGSQEEYSELLVCVSSLKYAAQDLPAGIGECTLTSAQYSSPGLYLFTPDNEDSGAASHSLSWLSEEKKKCLRAASEGQFAPLTSLLDHILSASDSLKDSWALWQLYTLTLVRSCIQALPQEYKSSPVSLFLTCSYWEMLLGANSSEELRSGIQALFSSLSERRADDERYSRHLVNTLHYISVNYYQELSLESVAEQNGISGFYLSRLFKQELNHTFLEILTDIRICRALDLLLETSLSAQEISEKCGYLNTSYFYKLFKKQTGMTIGEIRALISSLPG